MAAANVNSINLGLALLAGILSITSPCCLPLLPGYLGYLSGTAGGELAAARRRTVTTAMLFVGGFTAIFVALGATASQLGALLLSYRLPLSQVAGVVIILMGLVLLLEGRVRFLGWGGDWSRFATGGKLWTAPILGAAFAITWTPCIGPVLAAILTVAGTTADLHAGVLLLAAYSIGLGLPLVALSLSVDPLRRWLRDLGRLAAIAHVAAGAVLVAIGALLITNRWLPLMAPVLAWYAQLRWPPL